MLKIQKINHTNNNKRAIVMKLTQSMIISVLLSGFLFPVQIINTQGILRDANNKAVADDDYNITFRIYGMQNGGSALFEDLQTITIINGVYNAELEVGNQLENQTELWLSIQVEGDSEMSRVRLHMSPYDQLSMTNNDNVITASGKVGIGTQDPSHRLHIVKNEDIDIDDPEYAFAISEGSQTNLNITKEGHITTNGNVNIAGDVNISGTTSASFNNSLTANDLAPGSVGESELGSDAVKGSKIANDQINSEHYVAGSIDSEHIGVDEINSEHYAAGSIDNEHLADDAVGSDELQAGAGAYSSFSQLCAGDCYNGISGGTATGGNVEGNPRIITFDCPDEGALYIVSFVANATSGFYGQVEVHTTNTYGSFIQVGGEFSDEWTNNTMLERLSVTSPCLPSGQFRIQTKYLNYSDVRSSIIEWTY